MRFGFACSPCTLMSWLQWIVLLYLFFVLSCLLVQGAPGTFQSSINSSVLDWIHSSNSDEDNWLGYSCVSIGGKSPHLLLTYFVGPILYRVPIFHPFNLIFKITNHHLHELSVPIPKTQIQIAIVVPMGLAYGRNSSMR